MRVFLTGATGYIGGAVLDAFVKYGHEVTALVRDASRLRPTGAGTVKPLVADLGDTAAWAGAVEGHDVCVHAAFDGTARAVDIDRSAIIALLAGASRTAAGDRKPVVIYTSGVWVLGNTNEPADEKATLHPIERVTFRPSHEALVLESAASGIRPAVIRPGIVVGNGQGIVGEWFRDATNGLIRVVGPGRNRWPFVHRRDLADLYVRIATDPAASGIYHANDEGDERVIDVVEAIASQMSVRPGLRHVPIEEARAKLGSYADALVLDQVVRSTRSRALGWVPALRKLTENMPRLYEEWRRAQAATD